MQFYPDFGNKQKNLATIEKLVASTPGDVLVFPEFCTTGSLFNSNKEVLLLGESIPDGFTVKTLTQIAWRHRRLLIVDVLESCSRWDEKEETLYESFNTAVIISSQGYVEKIRKQKLNAMEKSYLKSGEFLQLTVKWKNIDLSINFEDRLIVR